MKSSLKPRVVFIIGTRPEAIKLAPLILEFKFSEAFITEVFLTGQHKEMVHQVLDFFQITFDKSLNLMMKSQTLTYITSRSIEGLEGLFTSKRPDLVIVQGDTTTAFTGALAAFYQKIPICHVEAGLRTGNLFNPYPEEANRRLISQMANYNFAPTKQSAINLKNENVPGEIHITGNTVVDAVLTMSKISKNITKKFKDEGKKIILTTVHRRENWGANIQEICLAINKLIKTFEDIEFIIPMHPNPIVRKTFYEKLEKDSRIKLIEPMNYAELVRHLEISHIILTDSGGLQEEAPTFGKPVLILRETTERPEAVDAGTAKLIGTSSRNIFYQVSLLINNPEIYNKMSSTKNPYGDGKASSRILDICKDKFGI